ncbi:O-antigen ligase family protein [Pedobacter ginsengisoli]|uniref:O-antigen ligase family protein n=1 Tax=Pedobacter ginsengisoli TaxID=363852 RepID=UPI0012FDECBD|nr:O-antigen ligase family protein [Pedobacter ginsengisoli]
MYQFLSSLSHTQRTIILSVLGIMVSVGVSILTYLNPMWAILVIIGVLFIIFLVFLFKEPSIGLFALVAYCFLFGILSREVGGIAYGIGIEGLLLLTWVAALTQYKRYDWKRLNNPLTKLMLMWFIISVVEIINPAGASVIGWLQEIRSTALFPVLFTPLVFLLFDSEKKLNLVLILLIGLSLLATMNGIKQQHIGLSSGEQKFLDEVGAITHLLWGRLRVFSFYGDSGQFGVSQASFVMITIVLAIAPFKWWKRILALIAAGLSFYGMLISGTRGAFFALAIGALCVFFLTKNIKVIILGVIAAALFFGFLKFTTIGNGNYGLYRLRSALNFKEASLNVRFNNQKVLRERLQSQPFGGGLGVIGTWGKLYNKDKFLSTIEPDSYWVKVWAMYGIVGLTIWFSMMMYIMGKCCGIIWKIRSIGLRYKCIALLSATAGIFLCSYGNEVINSMPSAIVAALSFAIIFQSVNFDKKDASLPQKDDEKDKNEPGKNNGAINSEIKIIYS